MKLLWRAYYLLALWFVFLLLSYPSGTIGLRFPKRTKGRCRHALGMESGAIPDSALTASSSHTSLEPKYARIRIEDDAAGGGAWCPLGIVTPDAYAYLQIDLGNLTVITRLETQGRHARGEGREYTEVFVLEFQRSNEDVAWRRFYQKGGKEEFAANTNTYSSAFIDLFPPLIARRIRIVPFVRIPKPVCLRLELYGCPWRDSLLSYDVAQGHTYPASEGREQAVSLDDTNYDGRFNAEAHMLRGGLGKLTDYENGNPNWRRRNTPWIGWSKSKLGKNGLQIVFNFDNIRDISLVSFYSLSRSADKIGVFKTATFEFSFDGVNYNAESETFTYAGISDNAAFAVVVPLRQRMCRYLRATLTHHRDMEWILISEVYFQSQGAPDDFKPTVPKSNHSQETTKSSERRNTDVKELVVYEKEPQAKASANSTGRSVRFSFAIAFLTTLCCLVKFLSFNGDS